MPQQSQKISVPSLSFVYLILSSFSSFTQTRILSTLRRLISVSLLSSISLLLALHTPSNNDYSHFHLSPMLVYNFKRVLIFHYLPSYSASVPRSAQVKSGRAAPGILTGYRWPQGLCAEQDLAPLGRGNLSDRNKQFIKEELILRRHFGVAAGMVKSGLSC